MRKKSISRSSTQLSPMAAPASRWSRVPKVLGAGLFATAIIVGLGAISAPAELTEYLVYSRSLPAGTKLNATDLTAISVTAESRLVGYQLDIDEVVGSELVHPVAQGELVAKSDLKITSSALQELTLSFALNSLPPDVTKGDQLDLWVVPQDGAGNVLGPAQLIGQNLVVAATNAETANISNELAITFFVLSNQVADLLDAVAAGEIHLVRR